MASKKKVEAPTTNVTNDDTAVPTTIGHGDFTATIADLSPKAVAYLLNYGLNKSLQDAIAGMKKELQSEMVVDGETVTDQPKYSAEEIVVILHDEQKARFDAVLSGTIGTRSAGKPKASKLESVMATVALERIKAGATKLGKALPKGEALASLKAAYIAKNEASLRSEAEVRMTNAVSADVSDLSDLLG